MPLKKKTIYSSNKLILANLEGPILTMNHSLPPLYKAGPHVASIDLPPRNNLYIFSLANNHILDYGISGLDETNNLIHANQFLSCGAGNSLQDARKPLIIQDGGMNIGIISCCEPQFGVANNEEGGVAEFGPWVYQTIRELKNSADYVIVSVHAGLEDYPWPSPYLRELYHSYIDAGATIIHGHHSHVPQGYEEYNNGLICYGLGNFAVDPEKWITTPNALWSLGLNIEFCKKGFKWKVKTFEIRDIPNTETILIEESSEDELTQHEQYLELCNRPLREQKLLESIWQEIAVRAFFDYGGEYMDFSLPVSKNKFESLKLLKKEIKKTFFKTDKKLLPGQRKLLLYYLMVTCDSHREMLKTALAVLSGAIPDLRNEQIKTYCNELLHDNQ